LGNPRKRLSLGMLWTKDANSLFSVISCNRTFLAIFDVYCLISTRYLDRGFESHRGRAVAQPVIADFPPRLSEIRGICGGQSGTRASFLRVLRFPLTALWSEFLATGFNSRRYQIFWEVVGLERDPLNLMSTIEELLQRKSSDFGLENREYGRTDPSR
jgi:hypothetical protein